MQESESNYQATTTLFGIPFFAGTQEAATQLACSWLSDAAVGSSGVKLVFTPNPEQIILAKKNLDFRAAMRSADLNVPDGIGVVWAGRTIHRLELDPRVETPIFPERIPGRVLFDSLVKECVRREYRLLLIGGQGSVATTAADRLQRQFAGFQVRGVAGPAQIERATSLEKNVLLRVIQEFRPQCVAVAFGAPKQELWLVEHRHVLSELGVRVGMAVGGTLDVLAGKVRPAPHWAVTWNLEWLFRLLQEPSRWRRQLRLLEFAADTARITTQLVWTKMVQKGAGEGQKS